jgi:hypothetical protein
VAKKAAAKPAPLPLAAVARKPRPAAAPRPRAEKEAASRQAGQAPVDPCPFCASSATSGTRPRTDALVSGQRTAALAHPLRLPLAVRHARRT